MKISENVDDIFDKIKFSLKILLKTELVFVITFHDFPQSRYLFLEEKNDKDPSRGIAKISFQNQKMIVIQNCSNIPRFCQSSYLQESSTTPTENIICVPFSYKCLNETTLIPYGVICAINLPQHMLQEIPTSNISNHSDCYCEAIESIEPILSCMMQKLWKFTSIRSLQSQNQKLMSLLTILRSHSLNHPLIELLRLCVREIKNILPSQYISIYLCDQARDELFIVSSNDNVEGLTISIGQGIAGHVALSGETIRLHNAMDDNRFLNIADKINSSNTASSYSILCVPLKGFSISKTTSLGQIGVIEVINKQLERNYSHEFIFYTSEDEKILTEISTELSMLIRLRSKELYRFKAIEKRHTSSSRTASPIFQKYHSGYNTSTNLDTIAASDELDVTLFQDFGLTKYRFEGNDKVIIQSPRYQGIPTTADSTPSRFSSFIHSEASVSTSLDQFNSFMLPLSSSALRCITEDDDLNLSPDDSLLDISVHYNNDAALFILNNYNFDPFHLASDNLIELVIHMLRSYRLLEIYSIDVSKLRSFLQAIRKAYHSNPFHNFTHVWGVLHLTFQLLERCKLYQYLTSLDILALMISAICHDVDHRGVTNQFEIASKSDLAQLYCDDMVLERHHAALTHRLLWKPENNFLENLCDADKKLIRKLITSTIFSTDMNKHFETVDRLQQHTHAYHVPCGVSTTSIDNSKDNNIVVFSYDNLSNREELLKFIIHCADIGKLMNDHFI